MKRLLGALLALLLLLSALARRLRLDREGR